MYQCVSSNQRASRIFLLLIALLIKSYSYSTLCILESARLSHFWQLVTLLIGSDEIPHRTAPDPQTLGEGSPQPGKTMGSHGTLPLMGGHP